VYGWLFGSWSYGTFNHFSSMLGIGKKKKTVLLSALAGGLTWEIYFVDLHNLFFCLILMSLI
jgi:hypothetical protein